MFGKRDSSKNIARDGSAYGKALVGILRPALDQQDARRAADKRAADARQIADDEWTALHEEE